MLTRWSLVLLGLVALAGTAAACGGLSPGDQLDAPGVICTLGFLVANADGLYFTTAGHCIHNDDVAATPDVGDWGVGVFHYLDPETGGPNDGSPGHDFALVRVLPEFYDQLNPAMCGWGGPSGVYDGSAEGGFVRWYGHGTLLGDISPQREGVGLATTEDEFSWYGTGVPGDSGGAVIAEDGTALGVLTHLTLGVGGTNGGTTLARGFSLAAEEGFTGLRLVLADEDPVEVLRQMRNAPPPAASDLEGGATTGNGTTAKPPSNGTNASPGKEPARANETSSGSTESVDDSMTPASTSDQAPAKKVPAPMLLAPLALALALALRKKQGL